MRQSETRQRWTVANWPWMLILASRLVLRMSISTVVAFSIGIVVLSIVWWNERKAAPKGPNPGRSGVAAFVVPAIGGLAIVSMLLFPRIIHSKDMISALIVLMNSEIILLTTPVESSQAG